MLQTTRSAGIGFGSPYSNCTIVSRQGGCSLAIDARAHARASVDRPDSIAYNLLARFLRPNWSWRNDGD